MEQLGALKEDNPENRILKLKRGRKQQQSLPASFPKILSVQLVVGVAVFLQLRNREPYGRSEILV